MLGAIFFVAMGVSVFGVIMSGPPYLPFQQPLVVAAHVLSATAGVVSLAGHLFFPADPRPDSSLNDEPLSAEPTRAFGPGEFSVAGYAKITGLLVATGFAVALVAVGCADAGDVEFSNDAIDGAEAFPICNPFGNLRSVVGSAILCSFLAAASFYWRRGGVACGCYKSWKGERISSSDSFWFFIFLLAVSTLVGILLVATNQPLLTSEFVVTVAAFLAAATLSATIPQAYIVRWNHLRRRRPPPTNPASGPGSRGNASGRGSRGNEASARRFWASCRAAKRAACAAVAAAGRSRGSKKASTLSLRGGSGRKSGKTCCRRRPAIAPPPTSSARGRLPSC